MVRDSIEVINYAEIKVIFLDLEITKLEVVNWVTEALLIFVGTLVNYLPIVKQINLDCICNDSENSMGAYDYQMELLGNN